MELLYKDIFLDYNFKEEPGVEKIVQLLEQSGLNIYYSPRDLPVGSEFGIDESKAFENARLILVLLGDEGWGPIHLTNAENALRQKKRIFPALIGNPPESAFYSAEELFRKVRYFDFRKQDEEAVTSMVKEIFSILAIPADLLQEEEIAGSESFPDNQRPRAHHPSHETLMGTLTDGDDEERQLVLDQIRDSKTLDRPAFSRRLREELTTRIKSDSNPDFTKTGADQKTITSNRSWLFSALIRTDAEDPENRDFLLHSLEQRTEPEENTRFWILTGLYLFEASYLKMALGIAQKDDSRLIVLLAEAINYANQPQLINHMAEQILKGSFYETSMALRVLRVVAIPQLAPLLCDKLSYGEEHPINYNVLFAMSNPGMAPHVVPHLKEKPGLPVFFDILAKETRNANANATRAFASLLQHFNPAELEKEFSRLRLVSDYHDAVDRLIMAGQKIQNAKGPEQISIAGYASDTIDVSKDFLDISEDVATLTAVIMATEVEPPLAIGLFGDWGSGKSFFMQSVRAEIERLSVKYQKTPSARFHAHFVHVEFNAWHYIDSNLMASLVSTIFEELAAHVSPGPTAEQKQKEFLSLLESVKVVTDEVKAEKARIEAAKKRKEEELFRIRKEKEEKIRLSDMNYSDLNELLTDDQRRELEDILKQMGIPAVINTITDLDKLIGEIGTAGGRASSLLLSTLQGKNRTLVLLLLLLILVVIPGAFWLLSTWIDLPLYYSKISVITTELVAIIGGATLVLRRGLKKMQHWLGIVANAKSNIDAILKKKRELPSVEERKLQDDICQLQAKEEETAAQLSIAHVRMAEIEDKLHQLQEEQSLSRFLFERTHADDYRKHLGLISTVRKDFKTLTERLKTGSGNAGNPVNRIVLYIDDLDRCPSDKVIEVLQAVHLLLAYKLFVVMVGVDPRWLLHSLGKSYDPFKTKSDEKNGADAWRTTPQNFIEKIFQIPYNLKPMSDTGFGSLIRQLLTPTVPEKARQNTRGVPDNKPTEGNQNITRDEIPPEEGRISAGDSNQPGTRQRGDTKKLNELLERKKRVFEINESSLEIRDWETEFAVSLLPFIPTPRAAKRFTNIYRILKASVPKRDLESYEGTEKLPGTFQVPMILLSILTGMPEQAPAFFENLKESLAATTVREVFERALKNKALTSDGHFTQFLTRIISSGTFPNDKELLAAWLPKVARFSFEVGRMVK
jgi:hypothetical protein